MLNSSVSLSAGFLALGLCLHLPVSAAAQQSPIVDLTDPYVSVDLSVLNDGGVGPSVGMPGMPMSGQMTGQVSGGGAASGAYQPPGATMPVSELYIKPTTRFKLPAQTKSIENTFAQAPSQEAPAQDMSAQELDSTVDNETPPKAAAVETAHADMPKSQPVPDKVVIAPPAPPAASETAEIADILPPPEAQEVAKEAPSFTPPAMKPAKPVASAKPAPQPAQEVAALTPPPPPKPTPAPTAPVSAPVEVQAKDVQTDPVAEPSHNQPMALKSPAPEMSAPSAQTQVADAATPPAAVEGADEAIPMPPPAAPQAATSNELIMPLPPKVKADPAQVASLPPASQTLSDGDSLRIVFDADSSKLPQSARNALQDMSSKMKESETLRLQLLAYAGTADTSASAARRLSLSRALAVRSFLIENGVRSTRIDVRALGNKSTDAVSERVDITVIER